MPIAADRRKLLAAAMDRPDVRSRECMMWSARRWRTCCLLLRVMSEESEGWGATKIVSHVTGSRINFNRRDPNRIYNAAFASSNRSGLIHGVHCQA